ncbi:MAG: hypothetical protein EAZ21_10760 [Betaproteobacteria bacterium]|nr:MAG: hypothetical protein EAZ21_10760 [Betaproteobacteria bacterium]
MAFRFSPARRSGRRAVLSDTGPRLSPNRCNPPLERRAAARSQRFISPAAFPRGWMRAFGMTRWLGLKQGLGKRCVDE